MKVDHWETDRVVRKDSIMSKEDGGVHVEIWERKHTDTNSKSNMSKSEFDEEGVRRESWASSCSWGDEGSTCLGLAMDAPWRSGHLGEDTQSEISTEVSSLTVM